MIYYIYHKSILNSNSYDTKFTWMKMVSFSRRRETVVKNSICAPTGSTTNDTSDYGLAYKNSSGNYDWCKFGIGQRRK